MKGKKRTFYHYSYLLLNRFRVKLNCLFSFNRISYADTFFYTNLAIKLTTLIMTNHNSIFYSVGSVIDSVESDVLWSCVVDLFKHSFSRGLSEPKSLNASFTSSSRHLEYKDLASGCSLYVESWYGKYMVKCQKQTKINRLQRIERENGKKNKCSVYTVQHW